MLQRLRITNSSHLCEACGVKPKYADPMTGVEHPYCGRTCAQSVARSPTTSTQGCRVKGCKGAEDPSFPGFCSSDHAKYAVSSGAVPGCIRCHALPQYNGPTCSSCAMMAPDELRLRTIKRSNTIWREFEREWKDRWKTGPPATIDKLFEICYPFDVVANKEAFQQSLESEGARLLRTFHASQCICDMGTNGAVLCDKNSCGICNIVKSGFEHVAFGALGHPGKYGVGLYSSRDASKADRFATSCTSSPYRVMIACDVIVPQEPSKNNSFLTGDLVVVRDSGTITPRFIVMYRKGS